MYLKIFKNAKNGKLFDPCFGSETAAVSITPLFSLPVKVEAQSRQVSCLQPSTILSFASHIGVVTQKLEGKSVHMQEKKRFGPFARCSITPGGTDGKISEIWMHKKAGPLGSMLPLSKYDLPKRASP